MSSETQSGKKFPSASSAPLTPFVVTVLCLAILTMTSCSKESETEASFVPLTHVTSRYGELITVGNHPTPDQYGTGERIALFRTSDGTIWGLPLVLTSSGDILVCVAPELRLAPITDRLPADVAVIVGATNQPTGWRGGTGQMELVTRDAGGKLGWHPVRSKETSGAGACWAPAVPGPRQRLHYYRLVVDQ